ncbi:MAG: sigma 54-interacting transcriptional regulator, partial [Acidobacteriota bacterium]
ALVQIRAAAPFLGRPSCGPARLAVGAAHGVGGAARSGVAGPGAARARLLREAPRYEALLALVSGERARDVWEGFAPDLDPWILYRRGQWRRAAAIWRRRRGLRGSEAVAFARSLIASGQAAQALEAVRRRKDPASMLTRLRCQMEIGERHAAYKTVSALEAHELSDAQTVKLAEIAVRLCAGRGHWTRLRSWVARALAVKDPTARLEGLLVAAGAAWDMNDLATMESYLESSKPALEVPALAWRWLNAESLRRYSLGDGPGAVEHAEAALRSGRRLLGRGEAARLWNDVAVMRLLADDLPGAERACRHVVDLMLACEGKAKETLALHNLAALRIRRGLLEGVEEPLMRNMAENQRANNPRAWLRDVELMARLELVRGRPAAALQRCAEAEQRLANLQESIARPRVFAAFAARAHGWLGHRERAAALLEQAGEEGLREMDVEERPAAWALAGDAERACREAEGTVWAPLFAALAAQQPPPDGAWERVAALEPYRQARLVHDVELLQQGAVPARLGRRAAAILRQSGAEAMAEVLESRQVQPWRALREYAVSSWAGEEPSAESLLQGAGYGDARLILRHAGGERVVVAGEGGAARLEIPLGTRVLRLEAPWLDAPLEALCALIARDLEAAPSRPREEVEALSRGEREEAGAAREAAAARAGDGIVGRSEELEKALFRLDRLAAGQLPVLILGESGTGKELMARRAHRLSARSSGPFLAVNCAAFSESLIQSELFGHVRGAFTGAERDRAGLFEAARGGTVFLDEIGDLPGPVQGHLLRVLQEGEIRRVGDSMIRKVDVRIVAATHRNLEKASEPGGGFRRDLYFRLKVAKIELPALRDRGEDLILLSHHLLKRAPGGARLSKNAERKLLAYPWPGNVRELKNVLEVAAALADQGVIEPHHLDIDSAVEIPANGDYHHRVKEFRKKTVREALRKYPGNRARAARSLGLTRQALSYLVRQLELNEE